MKLVALRDRINILLEKSPDAFVCMADGTGFASIAAVSQIQLVAKKDLEENTLFVICDMSASERFEATEPHALAGMALDVIDELKTHKNRAFTPEMVVVDELRDMGFDA